jgi:hypothetical protein
MEYFKLLPVKGQLYTVRMMIPNIKDQNDHPGFALEEKYSKIDTIKTYACEIRGVEEHFKVKRFQEVLPPERISIENFIENQEEVECF